MADAMKVLAESEVDIAILNMATKNMAGMLKSLENIEEMNKIATEIMNIFDGIGGIDVVLEATNIGLRVLAAEKANMPHCETCKCVQYQH